MKAPKEGHEKKCNLRDLLEKMLISLDSVIPDRQMFYASAQALKNVMENQMKCLECFENHTSLSEVVENCKPPVAHRYQNGSIADSQTPIIYQMNSFVSMGLEDEPILPPTKKNNKKMNFGQRKENKEKKKNGGSRRKI